MPRRQFVADLQQAKAGVLPHNIHDVQSGDDDGQFTFLVTFNGCELLTEAVEVTALIPELGDYPKSHEYIVFVDEDAPASVSDAVQSIRRTGGKTVFELLDIMSSTFIGLTGTSHDVHMIESQADDDLDEDEAEDESEGDVYDSDHEAFQEGPRLPPLSTIQNSERGISRLGDHAFRARIHSDLTLARAAGLRVGVLEGLLENRNAFVTLSVRMEKLGISDEAMQAWCIDSSYYLILIIHYANGYKNNEELQGIEQSRLSSNVGMRVCMSRSPKPTLQQAIQAFSVTRTDTKDIAKKNNILGAEAENEAAVLEETFISKSLVGLLQERLVPILRYRSLGLPWNGAEIMYHQQINSGQVIADGISDTLFNPEEVNNALPKIVNADHFSDSGKASLSFPLLAMQFLLRHFARCTEFCLVCHRKMDSNLEAMKPYICGSELCLYQYITLGFGTSIEHEILAQPYVVDLLISFCYSSASHNALKDFPDGLSLFVPPIDPAEALISHPHGPSHIEQHNRQDTTGTHAPGTDTIPPPISVQTFDVDFDWQRSELAIIGKSTVCPVHRGDWIVLKFLVRGDMKELHCRVDDTIYHPRIMLSEPITVKISQSADKASRLQTSPPRHSNGSPTLNPAVPATAKSIKAKMQLYRTDFKHLSPFAKCSAIRKLLDTLPSVRQMQEYLQQRQSSDLRKWGERISPAALAVLRWVIASNRACIMQVDGDEGVPSKKDMQKERVYGMKDYLQFRFAMGAPDKEQRFLDAVRNTTARLNLQHPTIFAWHGSDLYKWHMIIREGLHFKTVSNGRAYGDGVYHARDASISAGYSGAYSRSIPGGLGTGHWPNSILDVTSAIALNEVVNAPSEFRSHSPYYVVQHLDWIQTRYLFVQCANMNKGVQIGIEQRPKSVFVQDPNRIPLGTSREPIIIPASAIKSRRHLASEKESPMFLQKADSFKRRKLDTSVSNGGLGLFDYIDAASDVTDDEDFDALFADALVVEQPYSSLASLDPKEPETDFVPGSLDFNALPLMPEPAYATSATTRSLAKELQSLHKIQSATPLAELGWYVDADKIENVYQWIVELHSFHTFENKGKTLPLVEDLKKSRLTSVVLEVRFNKDFPFSPPYVRVIHPRFLSFAQGGGGHVVQGGAMCMELLTNSGWSSVSSMESVLMQIRLAIASEPFARLDFRAKGDYGTMEAADGYIRACHGHGWQVPPGFKEMAYGVPS